MEFKKGERVYVHSRDTRNIGESGCYIEDGNLCLSGQYVGGDFVKIIEQYIS